MNLNLGDNRQEQVPEEPVFLPVSQWFWYTARFGNHCFGQLLPDALNHLEVEGHKGNTSR